MKFLGIKPSRIGHKRVDYLLSVSERELEVLQLVFRKTYSGTFEKNDGREVLKNAHNSLGKGLSKLIIKKKI